MNSSILSSCAMPARTVRVLTHDRSGLDECLPRLTAYAVRKRPTALSRHPAWLGVLKHGLRHEVYCLEAEADGPGGRLAHRDQSRFRRYAGLPDEIAQCAAHRHHASAQTSVFQAGHVLVLAYRGPMGAGMEEPSQLTSAPRHCFW